jgi:oxygen-independent coproporphyrinogen-3 oxidase
LWDIQEAGLALLQQHDYQHYEISAFSKPSKQARHNVNYWQFGDYLGIGAGAHGKITFADNGKIFRTQKTRLPKDYLNPDTLRATTIEPIVDQDIGLECLMNALRLKEGIKVNDFEQRTGLTLAAVAKPIQGAQQLGLLHIDDNIYASEKGRQYLNNLLSLFLTDDE